jgi:hypothetical protein
VTIGEVSESEPITLSALEFDVVWEHLRLPEMPVVVGVPSPGRTHAERGGLLEQAWAGIAARGLGRQVGLHPLLSRHLEVLARPEAEVDARCWSDGEVRTLVAAAGGSGVHVTLSGDTLTFRAVEPSGLASTVLGALPDRDAGPGRSVTLPSADFEAAAADENTRESFAAALVARGLREDDAGMLVTMIGDVDAQGQFGAAARDGLGRRHRADRAVSYFETGEGRYVQIKRSRDGAPPWTTIAPVDRRRLSQHVDEMVSDVLRAAGR